jgi:hypothetical protein
MTIKEERGGREYMEKSENGGYRNRKGQNHAERSII